MSHEAYRKAQKTTAHPRDAEYRAFSEATRLLMAAKEEGRADLKQLIEAIHLNRTLWGALAADCADPANQLPSETRALIISLALLIRALPLHLEKPQELLRSAAALWLANILVFASWYWRLDAGGPHKRAQRAGHTSGAFLFPQMTMDPDTRVAAGFREWSPNFVDYLFLAFNTSTAFSPTDVPVLTRWAKVLMMLQSIISLLVIALLAARAVNIL